MNTNKAQILPNENPTGEKLVVLTSIITNLPGAFAAAVFRIFGIDMTNIVGIFFLTVVGLALSSAALADNHGGLAARGYRWVVLNGPYACNTEQDAQRLTAYHADAAELDAVQNSRCYYLIPGKIVQVIKQDPARGTTQMRVAGVPKPLWAYTRFLSEHPVRDLDGAIETPENSGLLPAAHAALPFASSTGLTRPNGMN
jgi:hypothetical protein